VRLRAARSPSQIFLSQPRRRPQQVFNVIPKSSRVMGEGRHPKQRLTGRQRLQSHYRAIHFADGCELGRDRVKNNERRAESNSLHNMVVIRMFGPNQCIPTPPQPKPRLILWPGRINSLESRLMGLAAAQLRNSAQPGRLPLWHPSAGGRTHLGRLAISDSSPSSEVIEVIRRTV
jgi:hypothetical protein